MRTRAVGTQWWMAGVLALSTALLPLVAGRVSAAESASEGDLAKKTQKPVSDLISPGDSCAVSGVAYGAGRIRRSPLC